MKTIQIFALTFILSGFFFSCGNDNADEINIETTIPEMGVDTTQFLADLSALEARINSSLEMPKEKDLKEAITTFQDFAAIFPDDPKAPDYLLKASDISLTTDQPQMSITILDQIIEKYPNYSRLESVKYNRASHLDFELRDTTSAKEAYQEFMVDYPNSPLVADCQSRIENIRYSMEELTEKFMKELELNGGTDL
ncbi:MAG: tetratricopeptide (TPR) repeat protein [Crocinitomix sp.]|jgi:tetratricopeptide (TPR) repeat protein